MKAALDDTNHLLKEPIHEKEHELVLKELIRIEIIATTLHYAEVFAATLLAMRRYRRFHKFLSEYEIPEIIDFYTQIPRRRLTYFLSLLQYPTLRQVQQEELRTELIESARDIQTELKSLARFYLEWRDFYNAYKHGLRLFAGKPNPDEDFTTVSYLNKNERLDTVVLRLTEEEANIALELCEFMVKILSNAESVFGHYTLMKERKFKFTIYSRRK